MPLSLETSSSWALANWEIYLLIISKTLQLFPVVLASFFLALLAMFEILWNIVGLFFYFYLFYFIFLQKTSWEAVSVTTLHPWQLHNAAQSCSLTPGFTFSVLNKQVLNLTGKDNFKSEPGTEDMGRYLSARKNRTKKIGPRSYPWCLRWRHKFAAKHCRLSWGEPKVVAGVLSIYASGENRSFLPVEHCFAAIFSYILQSAEWCFEIEDVLVWKEDKA